MSARSGCSLSGIVRLAPGVVGTFQPKGKEWPGIVNGAVAWQWLSHFSKFTLHDNTLWRFQFIPIFGRMTGDS
jgi:hypothetical protein